MKHRIIALMIIFAPLTKAFSQTGCFTIGGFAYERGFAVLPMSDGSFVFGGLTYTLAGSSNQSSYVVKTDASGNILWSTALESDISEHVYALVESWDGNVISIGASGNSGDMDLIVAKYSINTGDTMWVRAIDVGYQDVGYDIVRAAGGYRITGYVSDVNVTSPLYGFVAKIDEDANLVSMHQYGEPNMGYDVVETDSAYAFGGWWSGFSSSGFVMCYDHNDTLKWSATSQVGAKVFGLCEAADGNGFVATGFVNNPGFADAYVAKLDSNGNTVWVKTFDTGLDDYMEVITTTSDGGYVFAGQSKNLDQPDTIIASIFKCDADGNLLWVKGLKAGEIQDVCELSDGRIAAFGTGFQGSGDFFMALMNGDGSVCAACDTAITVIDNGSGSDWALTTFPEIDLPSSVSPMAFDVLSGGSITSNFCLATSLGDSPQRSLTVYPNPASDFVMVVGGQTNPVNAEIVDISGRVVSEAVVAENGMLDISDLSTGVYEIRLSNDAIVQHAMLVVTR